MQPVFRIIAGLTGAVMAIESLALLIGTHVVTHSPEWAVPKNRALIALDILGGVWLVAAAVRSRAKPV